MLDITLFTFCSGNKLDSFIIQILFDIIYYSSEVRKNHKYEGLSDPYIFQTIAVESSGVIGAHTDVFIAQLGHMTTSISGEHCEAEFLS